MGFIDQSTIKNLPDTEGASVIVTPEDEEKEKDQATFEESLFTESEMSITNEAVRLIGLKQALGVDATNTEYDKEIKGIIEWAKESGIKNKNQLMAEIRQISFILGHDDEKPKVRKIYEYVRIKQAIRGAVNKLEALRK